MDEKGALSISGEAVHLYPSASKAASPTMKKSVSAADRARQEANAKLHNPLAGFTPEELRKKGGDFARSFQIGSEGDIRAFEIGAVLAQDPSKYDSVENLTTEERDVLRREITHKWSHPKMMYLVISLCSVCATVQGMDETVVNGGQIFYATQFGISGKDPRSTWLLGLTNSAPYLCCALIGCWLTVPMNHYFGRRGTIFITCVFSALACVWQGCVNSWPHMFIARFALGFGIGPKSATVPIYGAEASPPSIRGALVMQWQVFTAFGIMLGYASDLSFFKVPDILGVTGLNWRLMMGSASVPAFVVVALVFLCPESPRWYMGKGRHLKAYEAMCQLRFNKIQAARDVFYIYTLLEEENKIKHGRSKMLELITVPRNRRAMLASQIAMFMQQFCGVNVIAYYSSQIFLEAKFSEVSALSASLGFGVINFLFAMPAVYTIDTFGRRKLLLSTLPLLAMALFFTGFSFLIPDDTMHIARTACIALGIYLFGIFYSPGMGPVPFTYSAEAYPLYVRAQGMALATATTWFFNFVLAITWPSLLSAFGSPGSFVWYGCWNLIGVVLVLLFLPETKGRTLEELDRVFSVPTHIQAIFGLRQLSYFFNRYVLRKKNVELEDPVEMHEREKGSGEMNFDNES